MHSSQFSWVNILQEHWLPTLFVFSGHWQERQLSYWRVWLWKSKQLPKRNMINMAVNVTHSYLDSSQKAKKFLLITWKSSFYTTKWPCYYSWKIVSCILLSSKIGTPLNFSSSLLLLDKIKVGRKFPSGKANFSAIFRLSSARCVRRQWLILWKLISATGGGVGCIS